ncbi:hypothetical protein MLD38_030062 [Melastoma candidum]|uniref:Uncharacterized protein n=1 Tax=Melastoma candidum TaxID=119954 RepID=A0ACB9MM15_9MYRT|nr:hypothetical protein MLD38_030062 [Melastoma candidum]
MSSTGGGGGGKYDPLDDPTNTETEDETVVAAAAAASRRRQNNRRVSFADEITSVHVFRRDDDYDATPPHDQDKSSDKVGEEGGIGLFRDSQYSQEVTPRDGGRQEEDEDTDGLPGLLFQRVDFLSPGSCTVGSFASSIDEDNAFGPVDANLIRQGMLSESPDSNDVSHEITMDSTSFSLHFQRLLQKNDMGGDLMTPDIYPSLEERTPPLGANSKSSMSLMSVKMKSPQSASPILDSRSTGKDSNAMSLFGENTRKYEYARLSPSLEALLVSNDVLGPGLNPENGKSLIVNKISTFGNEASAIKHVENSQNKETSIIATHEVSGTITPVHIELVTARGPNEKVPLVRPANIEEDGVAYADTSKGSDIQTPTQPLNVELGIVRSPEGSLRLNSLLNVSQELANEQDYDRSQMKGSISSLAAKRRQLFANVGTPNKPSIASPLSKSSYSLFEEETARRSASLSSIWKHISRLKSLDSSPTSARKFEASAMTLKLSTPSLSFSNKNKAPGSLDLHGKPAVSPLKRHLLGDDRSGMNTPMNPAVKDSAVESTQSPSKKIRELVRSPAVTGSAQSPSKETHYTQMQIMAKSPQEKRKAERNLENDSPLSKVPRLQIIPVKTAISSELPNDLVFGKEIIGDGRQSRHWKDALAKFLEYAANKFFPLVDKLDLGGVHMLDDMLARIQTARKYELLHSEIQSQPKLSYLRKNSEKRSSDLKLLFNKIAYEKARLLLDRMKHDRLKKAEENLKTLLQESHKLSAAYQNSLTSPSKTGPHPRNDNQGQDSAMAQKIALGTIKSLRQENDAMDEKIKSLSRSISTRCGIKGVVDCTKVKELADDSLRKRMTCRFIRQDFKAWKVCALDTDFGSQTVTLDYLGLIDQRIVVKANPVPSLTISNKLDSLKIEKDFPNMDASTAFAFLFPSQTREKYARSRSLAPGTQITNMLLRNLLDVIEELQLARLQINNFVDATFHASADGQLLLLLAFICFNKDRKLKLTLDLTCLIRGVYPSEIHPHNLEYIDLEDQLTSLAANVDAAIKELSPGHLRIMRLCRRVSKTMEEI